MSVRRTLACGVGVLAAAGLLHGQSESNQARIFGTVSAADTGRPLADGIVDLRPAEPGLNQATTRTDATGAFEFRDVPPGRPFHLIANAARYLSLGFGQAHPDAPAARLTLRAGQQRDASIILPRLGAVSGRVIDPFGDPLPGVGVYVFREAEVSGFRRIVAGGRPADVRPTDDLGQFRVDGLPPGDYYLGVLSGTLNASPRFNMTNELGGFLPTYYPGTTAISEAQRIRLGLGEQLNDLVVPAIPGRMTRVAGKVIDSKGQPLAGALMAITPSAADSNPAIAGRTQAGADGSFTFSNVPPGSYVLQGRSLGTTDAFTGEFGWLPLTVSGADLGEQLISTAGPSSLSGRLVFSGEPVVPNGQIAEMRDLFGVTVSAPLSDLAFAAVIPIASREPVASLNSDGIFRIDQLWGPRVIRVASRSAWMVERISVGGRDVTDTPIWFNGRDISGVEVMLTKRSASVSGRIVDARGEPGAGQVVVFPADPDVWTAHSRFVKSATAGRDGTFVVNGIPPGDYLAVAVSPRVVSPTSRVVLQEVRGRATSLVLPEGLTRDVVLTIVVP
jgi:protocatechuate 3,4-dioxygenase beta subunit